MFIPFFTILNGLIVANILLIVSAISVTVWVLSAEMYNYIAKGRSLTKDDLLYIYTGRVISLLDGYIKNKILNDKIEATESMVNLISLVNKWNYGTLTFITNKYGPSIDLFKETLSGRTLGVINSGSDQDIQDLIDALSDFLRYMSLSSLKKLDDINNLIGKLPEIKFIKFSSLDHVKLYLYNRPNIIRLVPAICVSLLSAFYTKTYWEWHTESFVTLAILIIGLIYANADKLFSIEETKSKINSKAQSASISFKR